MKKIRFAVVGCGHIGTRHLAILNAEPNAKLVAACDIKPEVIDQVSKTYHIDVYQNFEEMVKRTDIDIIVVATPHFLHSTMTIKAASRGKHILVEKPMALTATECKKMIATAKKNKVKLFVVKQNRHNSPIKLLKRAIDSGKLGKLYIANCNIIWNRHLGYYRDSGWRGIRKMEGGALYTQVSHFIDLLLWLFGDVKKVNSRVANLRYKLETEDSGESLLQFKNGALGSIIWTTAAYDRNYEGSILVIGENGTIKIGGKYLDQLEFWKVKDFDLPKDAPLIDPQKTYENYQGTSSNHDLVIKNVIANLNNKKSEVVEGLEGMRTVSLIEKMYKNII